MAQQAAEVVEIEKQEEQKVKTDKKYLNKAETLTRKMDKVLSDLYELRDKAQTLAHGEISTDINDKDHDRFEEVFTVLDAISGTLYMLTRRMARKYVGKEIADLDANRKTLKQ